MTPDSDVIASFAPTGKLRACINLGNPILATRRIADDEPTGVSVDLARGFAARLGVELVFVVVDAAGKSVETVRTEQADIGFFAIDPKRAVDISFTAPYVLIEGAYLVPDASPIRTNDDVDRPGIRVVVGRGSAYDLYLTRTLEHAEIVRAPTSPKVVDTCIASAADVAAGVRQQLEDDARRLGGLRLIDGRFMVIEQAMGVPISRGTKAALLLKTYVEDVKRSGAVRDSLDRHGIRGAPVAPPVSAWSEPRNPLVPSLDNILRERDVTPRMREE